MTATATSRGTALRRWGPLVFGAWTLYGLVMAALWMATGLPESGPWYALLPLALTVGWFWALATPAISWWTRRLATARIGLGLRVLGHAVLVLALALLVTQVRREVLATVWSEGLTPFAPYFFYHLDVYVLAYGTVVGVTLALTGYREYRERTRRTLALETRLSQTQLQYLQRQLQPHFLFNCLNAIAELAHEAPASAATMLGHLRELLRNALARRDGDAVTLREELATLEPYLEIQRTRFGDALTIVVDVAPAAWNALVPHLVLQPLVENAIQHGLGSRAAPGLVTIRAESAGGQLRVQVCDNGAGVSRAATGRGGIGLRNTTERLAQLYGQAHKFTLSDGPEGGAVADLTIPLQLGVVSRSVPESEAQFVTPVALPAVTLADVAGHAPGRDRPAAAPAPSVWSVRARMLGIVLLAWSAAALFWTYQVYFFSRAQGMWDITPFKVGAPDLASAAAWVVFTPLVLWLARRVRITRSNWRYRVALHFALACGLGVIQLVVVRATGLMGPAPLLSTGYVNPFLINVLVYATLLTWSHVRDFSRWYRDQDLAAVRLEAAIAHARWQGVSVELRPEFVLGTLTLIADVVRRDIARAERLIGRFADVLRLTLDGAGRERTPLRHELGLLSAYLDLRRQQGSDADVEIRVEPDLWDAGVPSRSLRGLLDRLWSDPTPGGGYRVTVDATRRHGIAEVRVGANFPLDAGFVSGAPTTPVTFESERVARIALDDMPALSPAGG